MKRRACLLMPLLLIGCGETKSDPAPIARVEADQRSDSDDDGRIVCARNGSSDFARVCTLERATSDTGLTLVVRHPDGAFHRLLVTTDGRGIVAADGAERAVVTVTGPDQIEVALGGDRYRLPATVRSAKPKA